MAADEYVILPGSHRTLPPDAQRLGRGNAGEHLSVTLQLRWPFRQGGSGAAGALIHQVPGRRRHLSREEFDNLFGGGPVGISLVQQFAADCGLDVVGANSAARTVTLTGTRRHMERAFRVELLDVRAGRWTFRGRSGPVSIPRALASAVQGVFGLDNRPQARPHVKLSRVRHRASSRPAYTPRRVADLYGLPTDCAGRGQTIALVELGGGFSPEEVGSYFAALNLPCPRVTAVSVDGARFGPTGEPDGPDGAVLLDIAVIGAVAPEARLVVYFAENTAAGFLNAIHSAVHDPVWRPSVLSIGWGSPERHWTRQSLLAFDEAFKSAALLGVTVCVASGIEGSSDGVADGRNHVDFPASSPHVLSCGGTRLTSSRKRGLICERGWGGPRANGASGGGFSRVFGRPAWQQIGRAGSQRGVPDVAGNADPASGYRILVDGVWAVAGGTSAAASLWSAIIACANQRLGSPAGFVTPMLYAQRHLGIVRDITAGTNGAFTAGRGWDPVTGLGSPRGRQLLCPSLDVPGLMPALATVTGRGELTSRLRRLADPRQAIVVSDPDDSSLRLVPRQDADCPTIEVVMGESVRSLARTHPVAAVLPDALPEQGMVDTVRWRAAGLAYLDPDLHGPTLPWREAAGDGLLDYLARVFATHGETPAGMAGRRYVEPGVGRSYLIDFLGFAGSAEFCDFSASGAGPSPYCQAGYLLPNAITDGNMAAVRAWHRHHMAVRLDAAGIRVPRTAAIIDLPGRQHRMPDGVQVPAAMLIRGFRTVVRVKQLDPLANLMWSLPWWRLVQEEVSRDEVSAPASAQVSCTCYTPSIMLGSWPGRQCDATSACFQQRLRRLRAGSPPVLELARIRLSVGDGRDPVTELMSAEEFAVRFADLLGAQLSGLRRLRVLHDYRVLREPSPDSGVPANSLCDTNLTLAAELADLDTAIAVDEPACEESLLITRAERQNLAAHFDDLHAVEARLASGICRTVALIAATGAPQLPDAAEAAFWHAYRAPSP